MGPSAKKRKLTSKVEEVNFDDAARHEFLTGFRKRKLQRARHAQEIAEKKAKEEKREERKKIREERTAEFKRVLEAHERQLKRLNGETSGDSDGDNSESEKDESEEEWEGFTEPPAVDYEAEYIDEDKYTTVTVEEMDPSKEALYKSEIGHGSDDEANERAKETAEDSSAATKSVVKKKAQKTEKSKKKQQKFRYESKEERKLTRTKERLSNRRKAQARRER